MKKGDAKVRCSAISLAKRKANLDRIFVDKENDVYAVMDGTTEGRQFSRDFVVMLEKFVTVRMHRLIDVTDSVESTVEEFESLVIDAGEEIPERISERYGGRISTEACGAGSTLTLVRKSSSHWICVNSGDSTAFLVREGRVLPLTYTDSEWNEWIEDGIVEVVDGVVQCEVLSDGQYKYAGVTAGFLEVSQSKRRMVRWIGHVGIPHINVVPCELDDILVLWTDGVDHIVSWEASKRFLPDHEKIVQSVMKVVSGEVEHLLAAFPNFWKSYSENRELADDTTVLVVYEG